MVVSYSTTLKEQDLVITEQWTG
ncbi:hypothetical protein L3Y34_018732 [Caenorhabditis briggsae]|uniref:Uncharacterized protein n=1 Tax=Caenorhabditis briggsae TaxID=6238 RepID=A0AAE9DMA3_CAEBR|nr:hypothetical protein L3Y34_018732 [Caenorhabditis briggsae]